jgi:hypothetical protein
MDTSTAFDFLKLYRRFFYCAKQSNKQIKNGLVFIVCFEGIKNEEKKQETRKLVHLLEIHRNWDI